MKLVPYDLSSSGFDPKNYECAVSQGVLLNANLTLGAYKTILDIAGEGYIEQASFLSDYTGSTAQITTLKVTLDGVVVFEAGGSVSSNYPIGFFNINSIGLTKTSAADMGLLFARAANGRMSYISGEYPLPNTTQPSIILRERLFFEQSCKVELKITVAENVPHLMIWGVKK